MDQPKKVSRVSNLLGKAFSAFFGTTPEVQRERVYATLCFLLLASMEGSSLGIILAAGSRADTEFGATLVYYYHLVLYVVVLVALLRFSKGLRKRFDQMSLNRAWYVLSDVPFGYYVNIVGENRPRHQGRQIPQPIKPGLYTVTLTQHGGSSIYQPLLVSAGECIHIVIVGTSQIEIRRSI